MGIFKVSLKNHLLLIKEKYHIRLSIQNMKFTQLGLLLETFLEVKTASQQLFEKHFATICFCRLENSTKFADKISKTTLKFLQLTTYAFAILSDGTKINTTSTLQNYSMSAHKDIARS